MSERVLVIGGSSNLGLASARRLSGVGYAVTIAGRDEDRLRIASRSLGSVDTGVLDVTDPRVVADFFAARPSFDHFVITAAKLAFGPFLQSDERELRRAFDSRVWGAYNVVRHGVAHLAARGSITLFTGIITEIPRPGLAMMAASGGAVEALTRSLAVELAPVRVNAISPGNIGSGADSAADHRTKPSRSGGLDTRKTLP